MMVQPSFIRPGSDLHRACIGLYQRHQDLNDGSGRCATCGYKNPCSTRRHAALVIRATGEDPRWYDEQGPHPSHPPASPHPHPSLDTPGVTGFAVGGRGQRAHVPYMDYER